MTIEEMNKKLEELKESIDKALAEVTKYEELIRQIKAQEEPKFERKQGEKYFTVATNNGRAECCSMTDNSDYDETWYRNNNYFYTAERAKGVADKIDFLLKLERLHDIYCPDYVPDWYDAETAKWYVLFNNSTGGYDAVCVSWWKQNKTNVYFPTEEIAQKVCDILNKEREENETD